jgi:LmbE family N-acetylglucosaminyl deacetylase
MLGNHILPFISQKLKRRIIGFERLLQTKNGEDIVVSIDKPKGPKVLVLAPHPDDELIGCGGTLRKHCLAGDEVVCLYLTSGESSSGFSHLDQRTRRELRENEVRKGASIIGIEKLIFLQQKDGKLQLSEEVVSAVTKHIRDLRPDVVYLPFFLDKHHDHFQTNRILDTVYQYAYPTLEFRCAAYETFTPLLPNCVVDIEEVVAIKRLALEQHSTALDAANVIDMILGLNKYRSLQTSNGNGHAEAYLYTRASRYFELFHTVV